MLKAALLECPSGGSTMGDIAVVQPQRRAPRVPTQFLNLFLTTTTTREGACTQRIGFRSERAYLRGIQLNRIGNGIIEWEWEIGARKMDLNSSDWLRLSQSEKRIEVQSV